MKVPSEKDVDKILSKRNRGGNLYNNKKSSLIYDEPNTKFNSNYGYTENDDEDDE